MKKLIIEKPQFNDNILHHGVAIKFGYRGYELETAIITKVEYDKLTVYKYDGKGSMCVDYIHLNDFLGGKIIISILEEVIK